MYGEWRFLIDTVGKREPVPKNVSSFKNLDEIGKPSSNSFEIRVDAKHEALLISLRHYARYKIIPYISHGIAVFVRAASISTTPINIVDPKRIPCEKSRNCLAIDRRSILIQGNVFSIEKKGGDEPRTLPRQIRKQETNRMIAMMGTMIIMTTMTVVLIQRGVRALPFLGLEGSNEHARVANY